MYGSFIWLLCGSAFFVVLLNELGMMSPDHPMNPGEDPRREANAKLAIACEEVEKQKY